MTAAQVELEEGKCTGLLKNKHLDLEEGSLLIISCKIRWEVYRIQQKIRESHRWRSFFFFFFFLLCVLCVWVAQSYLTLWPPMDCGPPGSSVLGVLQARILEWVAMSSSTRSSQPRDWTWVSCIGGRFFTVWVPWEAPCPFFFFPATKSESATVILLNHWHYNCRI